jgi:hypothetical protein
MSMIRRKLSSARLLSLGVFLLFTAVASAQIQICDPSGNKMVAPSHVFVCPVTYNGQNLLHPYTSTGFWYLYSPTGTLLKYFDAYTINNNESSQNGECGPANMPDSTGYASDGSAQYIVITNYADMKGDVVYNANGSVAYGPFSGCQE